jgi:ribonuclease HI
MPDKEIIIYTDGASKGNPGEGGWAAVLTSGKNQKEIWGYVKTATNNQMELTAAIEAFKCLKMPCVVTLISDSKYLVDAFRNNWIDSWLKNNWITSSGSPVKNQELWEELLKVTKTHIITWKWVKAHSGELLNEYCDSLANKAIETKSCSPKEKEEVKEIPVSQPDLNFETVENSTILKLGINFISPEVEEMYRTAGFQDNISSGFDLISIEDVHLSLEDPFALINLGVNIKPPEGFHSLLIPRSSTYKNYHIIQVNHLGLIDANYIGKDDIWKMPVLYLPPDSFEKQQICQNSYLLKQNTGKEICIPKGTRICQFFLQPIYRFETYRYTPSDVSRGGHGSTNKPKI